MTAPLVPAPQKSFLLTAIFAIVLGVFGVDRFYVGKVGTGIVKLLTCGGAGVWWLIDIILILAGKTVDKNNQPLAGVNTKNRLIAAGVLLLMIIIGAATPKDTNVVAVGQEPNSTNTEQVAEDLGTRENPLPLGSTIELDGEWEITLNNSTLNANSVVADANMFNDKPDAESQYASVVATLKYIGTETATPMFDLNFKFVSAAGTTHTTSDKYVAAEGQVSDLNEMYPDATAEGLVFIQIPTADAANGTWTVSTIFGDPMHFKASK